MLHRLTELDALVRQAYADFDYKRIFAALNAFMTAELSAFYFDIRKDVLYCDPISSVTRKACLTVLDHLFRATVTWLAPMLPFTAEEAWLARYPSQEGSVHLELFPELPSAWRNDALAEKWRKVRTVRRVVTGAIEIERAQKRIGSSLEAAPVVYISDPELFAAVVDVDFAEVAITSDSTLVEGDGPPDAFRLDEVNGVAVEVRLAEGRKCARSWKILPSVGSDPAYPDVSPRDAKALREWEAMRRQRSNDGGGRPTHKRGVRCARVLALGAADPIRARGGRGGRGDRPGGQALALVRIRFGGTRPAPVGTLSHAQPYPEYWHQLWPVPAGGAVGAMGSVGAEGDRRDFAVDLAVADDLAARGAEPRPHHRRGDRQRHRPHGPWLGGGFRAVSHHHREFQLQLVRF